MTLPQTTEDETKLTTIKELITNKATGPISILAKILKNSKNELAKLLGDLINLVLQSGTFPNILKTAKFIPFYKMETPQSATTIILFHYYQI